MQGIELIILVTVLVIAAILLHRLAYLHNKKIGYISLMQIYFLVILPGFLFTVLFSYTQDILERPLNSHIFLSDRLLTSLILLSCLYSYGGIAIHSLAKTLSQYFAKNQHQTMVYKVNQHFHLGLSHNLTYTGGIVSATCLCLLELNHLSPYPQQVKTIIIILNGFFFGLASILSLKWYEKDTGTDVKFFFFSLWAMLIILLYAIRPYIRNFRSYPITMIMLIAFSVLALLKTFVYIRRFRNRLRFRWHVPKDLFD